MCLWTFRGPKGESPEWRDLGKLEAQLRQSARRTSGILHRAERPPSRALLLEFRSVTLERDSEPIDDQRQAVCDSRSHRRGPASRCSGCGESFSDDGYIQYPAAGKASRELADSGAGQRAAGSPGCSTLKGKRDYVILSLLVGCALRRRELASLSIEEIQMREGRWVIADLRGKAIASGPWPYPSG